MCHRGYIPTLSFSSNWNNKRYRKGVVKEIDLKSWGYIRNRLQNRNPAIPLMRCVPILHAFHGCSCCIAFMDKAATSDTKAKNQITKKIAAIEQRINAAVCPLKSERINPKKNRTATPLGIIKTAESNIVKSFDDICIIQFM